MVIFFLGENLLCFCSCVHDSNSEDGEHAATCSINPALWGWNSSLLLPHVQLCFIVIHIWRTAVCWSPSYSWLTQEMKTKLNNASHFVKKEVCELTMSVFVGKDRSCSSIQSDQRSYFQQFWKQCLCFVPFFKLPVFRGLFHHNGRVFSLTDILWDISQSSFFILYILDSKMQ